MESSPPCLSPELWEILERPILPLPSAAGESALPLECGVFFHEKAV